MSSRALMKFAQRSASNSTRNRAETIRGHRSQAELIKGSTSFPGQRSLLSCIDDVTAVMMILWCFGRGFLLSKTVQYLTLKEVIFELWHWSIIWHGRYGPSGVLPRVEPGDSAVSVTSFHLDHVAEIWKCGSIRLNSPFHVQAKYILTLCGRKSCADPRNTLNKSSFFLPIPTLTRSWQVVRARHAIDAAVVFLDITAADEQGRAHSTLPCCCRFIYEPPTKTLGVIFLF